MRTRHLLLLRDSTSTRQRCLGLRVGPPADRYIFMLRRLACTPNLNLSLAPLRTLSTLPSLRSLVCTLRTASAAVAVIIRENVRTMSVSTPGPVKLPECWGHRGVSVLLPVASRLRPRLPIRVGLERAERRPRWCCEDSIPWQWPTGISCLPGEHARELRESHTRRRGRH